MLLKLGNEDFLSKLKTFASLKISLRKQNEKSHAE